MPLMERVREIGADEARIYEESVRLVRQALTREIARSARPARARRVRRRWAGIGVGALTVGAAVTAIVVGGVVAPPGGPDGAAAAVLDRAADVTIDAQDTAMAAGQYLRIETDDEYLQFWRAEWAEDDDEDTFPFNAGRDGAYAAVLIGGTRVLYVPADREDSWYYDWGTSRIIESFGARGEEATDDWRRETPIQESGNLEELPAGEFLARGADAAPMPYLADRYRPYYDEMPREPAALLEWLRAQSGMSGTEADRWLVAGLSDPSAINLMPADLRAAFFRALALLPGLELLSEDGATAALRYAVPGHRTTVIVIDTVRGHVVSISESYGSGGVADGIPESTTRVEMTIVDTVP